MSCTWMVKFLSRSGVTETEMQSTINVNFENTEKLVKELAQHRESQSNHEAGEAKFEDVEEETFQELVSTILDRDDEGEIINLD